jgi:hypothetical protein
MIRIHASDYWIRIRIQEAQKHTDPTDPDLQHCTLPVEDDQRIPGSGQPVQRHILQAVHHAPHKLLGPRLQAKTVGGPASHKVKINYLQKNRWAPGSYGGKFLAEQNR